MQITKITSPNVQATELASSSRVYLFGFLGWYKLPGSQCRKWLQLIGQCIVKQIVLVAGIKSLMTNFFLAQYPGSSPFVPTSPRDCGMTPPAHIAWTPTQMTPDIAWATTSTPQCLKGNAAIDATPGNGDIEMGGGGGGAQFVQRMALGTRGTPPGFETVPAETAMGVTPPQKFLRGLLDAVLC